MKCLCGNETQLEYRTQYGRYKDKYIDVYNTPIQMCNNCGESFMTGSDSANFAVLVEFAYKNKFSDIDWNYKSSAI